MFSALRFRFFLLGVFAALLPALTGLGQTRDYHSELAAALQEAIQTDTVIIRKLDLGGLHPGKNRFAAT